MNLKTLGYCFFVILWLFIDIINSDTAFIKKINIIRKLSL